MASKKLRIYKTKPTGTSGYTPVDVARSAPQARSLCRSARRCGDYANAIIVKTGKQGKHRSGSYKGESRLTYTIYAKEKRR